MELMSIFPFVSFVLVLSIFFMYAHKETLIVENRQYREENSKLKSRMDFHGIIYTDIEKETPHRSEPYLISRIPNSQKADNAPGNKSVVGLATSTASEQ